MSPQLRDCDHHTCLANEPLMVRTVIHDPCAPADRALDLRKQLPAKDEAKVAQPLVGMKLELLFAGIVLRVAADLDQEAGAPARGEVRAFVLIPAHHSAGRSL